MFDPPEAAKREYARILKDNGLLGGSSYHHSTPAELVDEMVVYQDPIPKDFVEVPGWEGLYAVNKAGEVWSMSRPYTFYHMRRRRHPRTGRMMKTKHHRSGLLARLTRRTTDEKMKYGVKAHETKDYFVSNLVWMTFRGPIPETHAVKCVNGDRYDCRLENLDLVAWGGARTSRRRDK